MEFLTDDSDANIQNICNDVPEIKKLLTLLHLGMPCGTDLVATKSLRLAHPTTGWPKSPRTLYFLYFNAVKYDCFNILMLLKQFI